MIENLKKNIESEISMVQELREFFDGYLSTKNKAKKRLYSGLVKSLAKQIKLVNNSVPQLIEQIRIVKRLSTGEKSSRKAEIEHIKEVNVHLTTQSKDKFLEELNISEKLLKKLKKKGFEKETKELDFRKPSIYGKFANKIFLNSSEKLLKDGNFKGLAFNIRRSNINILASTYLSMMFLSTFIGCVIGILSFITIMIFNTSLFLKLIWLPLVFPLIVFLGYYSYPGAERNSLGKRIDAELPFVVIHMGSISGSGIKPLELLKIVATSKDYKYAGQEVRKLLNQTNIYGYDLSTALRNVAMSTPSSKFAELLNGMGVTISSGGDMKRFFEKRAESLLLEYRLEREKDTKVAETFMDLYISIVIATPMILLMILMMVSVAGIQTGFSPEQLAIAVIGIVVIVNGLFLTFLHLKQPTI